MYKLIILLVVLINVTQDGVASKENYSDLIQGHRRYRSGSSRTSSYGRGRGSRTSRKRPSLKAVRSYSMLGGYDALPSEIPYIVSLRQDSTGHHFCGGAIVSKNHVLTAAHCFCGSIHYKPTDDMMVITAVDRISKGEFDVSQIYHIRQTICHPGFKEVSLEHDIALVVTETNFRFNRYVYQIPMAVGNFVEKELIGVGIKVTLAGWGKRPGQVKEETTFLQFIASQTISLRECSGLMKGRGFQPFAKAWDFCTYNYRRRNCIGNIGTPVVDSAGQLMGITTWSNCKSDVPDVHASTKHHYTWIFEQIEITKDING